MESLTSYFSHVKIITPGVDRVNKLECMCSFDTPESNGGLFICMKTFEAVSQPFLNYYHERYGHAVYLHHERFKYKIDKPESAADARPKRLAIGLEHGFDPDAQKDYKFEDTYSIVIMPSKTVLPLPDPDLPELVLQSVESILSSESEEILPEKDTNVWDGELRRESKFAKDLLQLKSDKKIPPSNWKCDECDLKENLWLNLTDGSVLCGRRFYDGTGGNNHAAEHYEKCKYPLAVKLGTITSDSGDVYSYPEDDMVIDPFLNKHLAHFGIDVQNMTKTEKSMIELEIDMNQKLGEWSVIQEQGKELVPVGGPGFTGFRNLGNSCYMNSVLQVLFSLEEFQQYYYPPIPVFTQCDGPSDFVFQMAKLAYGIFSGRYSDINPYSKEQLGIAPKSFKRYVCGQDVNFASKRQQDAHEFFLFLLDKIENNNKFRKLINIDPSLSKRPVPSNLFKIRLEDRIECAESKQVKYTYRDEYCLSLCVDLNTATNKDELEEYENNIAQASNPEEAAKELPKPRPRVPISSCIEQFSKAETIDDFLSPATKTRTTATKTTKIRHFPKIVSIQMKKFQLGEDWIPKKLDVAFEVPDYLALETLQARGKQDGEIIMDSETSEQQGNQLSADNFAQASVQGRSGENSRGAQTIEPDSEAIATLVSMGIDVTQAITALKACNNDAQRAIEYIFDPLQHLATSASEAREVISFIGPPPNHATGAIDSDDNAPLDASSPRLYHLKGFISHMGTSTMSGHYVCHIKKDERWYIFNDNKVAISEDPPKEFGYLYFYEQM